jgi:ketosteroid isomerase-like protein
LSLTTLEFRRLLQRVADSWNVGDARRAAECFAEDAVYSEPPDTQLYRGRAELYRFFGGDETPDPPMQMAWHYIVFDEDAQVGAGEYTFQAENRYHGAVFVRVRDGLIRNWREYQYRSDLDWEAFVGENTF